jgi:TonB-linked SusC/RagA family outer membrane protein
MTPNISNAPDIVKWEQIKNTDWQRYVYGGTGRVHVADANVTGGDKFTKYRISMGYETRSNITTASGSNNRISFSNNISHNTRNNIFKIDLTSLYSHTKINTIDLPTASMFLSPNAPDVFNSQGKLNYSEYDPVGYLLNNFQGLLRSYNTKGSYLNNRLSLTFLPIKGLQLKTALGYSAYNNDEKYIIPIISQNPLNNPTGELSNGITKGTTWIIEPQIEYKFVKNAVKTEFLIGSTLQSTDQTSLFIQGTGYRDDNLLQSVANSPVKYGTDAYGQSKFFAVFSRINFNLRDKYIVNINARRDGSSRFAPGKQFGNFWSIGGAWVISSEKWFQGILKVISFAKLRSSFGTVGSDNINGYVYLTRWSGDRNVINPYGGSQSYAPTQHANPELHWQENRKLEIAGNFNFLKDKIATEIVWYRDRCGNQLLIAPLPVMTGFSNVSTNLPATVQNSGWEVRINADILSTKGFNISSNFNIGANVNKLIKFANIENTVYASQYTIGKPLNTRFVYKYTGVDPNTGLYTFEDLNKDGIVSSSPSLSNPDCYGVNLTSPYFGGFGLNVSFRNISLNSFFTFGNIPHVLSARYSTSIPGTFGTQSNQSKHAVNRWQKPGDVAEFARYTTVPVLSDYAFSGSDGVLSEGSYLRLQNINLNYSFSKKSIQKLKLTNANIFIRAENVFLITNYDGMDPTAPGLGNYPLPFIITMGANISF